MRILVIEDEARLAQTLAELLHRQGYTADISGDGLSGLDNAASDIYDLVVLASYCRAAASASFRLCCSAALGAMRRRSAI